MKPWPAMNKAWLLAGCMLGTAVFSAVFHPRPQALSEARALQPLEQLFPARFAGWQLDPVAEGLIRPAFEKARQFQMYDQVLERTYVDAQGHRLMLSVAYGRRQSVGLQMHRPEVCYQAGGFQVEGVQAGEIALPAGRVLPVTHLFAHLEGRPEPVTYWRTLGDEVVAGETGFKLRQLRMGLSGHMADGMLVRVSSIDANVAAAHQLHDAFVRDLASALNEAQRERVLGWSALAAAARPAVN